MSEYRQCSLSVMDTIADPDITFDEQGVCNYYYEFKKAYAEHVRTGEEGDRLFRQLVETITKDEAQEYKPLN